MSHEKEDSAPHGTPQFATTRWSLVISAGRKSSPVSQQALETLCETYWYPLYLYARRRVTDASQAQDMTQAFFAELLEKNYVGSAKPERGRFRDFLLTAFKHFMAKEWKKAKAQKRGGGRFPISLNFESAESSFQVEPASGLTAEQFYDQQWTITLLGKIMERLKLEFVRANKADQFQELKGLMVGDSESATFTQAAERLNMTEAAARKAASRMRKRYRELLRDEISQTVSGPEEVENEIRKLFSTLEL
jgi:DNA-directed RNA polymerase specialized sigma24 family protein